MSPDSADAFWLAFLGLFAYECFDKHGAFVLRLVRQSDGWRCWFPVDALRIRDGYLHFHGPLDWLRVEVCLDWLRVRQSAVIGTPQQVGDVGEPVGADEVRCLQVLRLPVATLAIGLLVVLPLAAWFFGVSNPLLLAMAFVYASAAWLGSCLFALGRHFPAARAALRSLALEIFFCPLFGIGALRKAVKLVFPTCIAAYRDVLAEGEWLRLCGWVDGKLTPLEAYWQDSLPGPDDSGTREKFLERLGVARAFYKGTGDATE